MYQLNAIVSGIKYTFERYFALSLVLWLSCFALYAQHVKAAEVVLNPVDISGKTRFLDHTINSLSLTAVSGTYSAQRYFSFIPSGTVTEGEYAITVNVEEGSSRDYTLVAHASSSDDGGRAFGFKPRVVIAIDLDPAQATIYDLIQSEVSYFEPDIRLPEGATIVQARFEMYFRSVPISYQPDTNAGRYTLTDFSGDLTHPLAPNEYMYIKASINVERNGTVYPFVFHDYITSADANETHVQIYEIELAETVSLETTMHIAGPTPVSSYDYSTGAYPSVPWNRKFYYPEGSNYYVNLRENLPAADNYQVQLSVNFFDGLYHSRTTIPNEGYSPSRFLSMNEPGTRYEIDISANQAFINGRIDLSDNVADMLIQGRVVYRSLSNYLHEAQGTLRPETSDSRAVVLDIDEWRLDEIFLGLQREDRNYNQFYYSEPTVAVNPYETFAALEETDKTYALPMGSVTVNYSVTDGSLVSLPELAPVNWARNCQQRAPDGTLLYQYTSRVRNYSQIDLPTAQLTLYGPSAICTNFKATASVNGSVTTFGLIDFEVIADVDIVLDIGGPQLTVDVEPNALVEGETLNVTGTVTDDIEVTSVTVNGYAATLTSTNNPDDLNEMAFSVEIPLALGINELVTIATDSSDKQGQDTRAVLRDEAAPLISLSPADGTVFIAPETIVTVVGQISDDLDVASATLNGNDLALTQTGEGLYSFAVDLNLDTCGTLPCATEVSIEASDTVGRTSLVTHTLRLEEEAAQVCGDFDADQDVDIADRSIFLGSLRSTAGSAMYREDADFDEDGVISFNDYRAWYQCYMDYRAVQ